ncbi:MAG: Asp-tRNA(Asn)/Glu-tRNA(Gln) amidotransferase subunit GatB [Actinobacteria bacterium]|nr:Asp-tRNA(Asn)/Glu-tRNA(Gln) amidotransferase subunit GatB [Actinomycetota bacterium]
MSSEKNNLKNSSYTDSSYETIIGLETHVELATNTKMFCGCALSFGAEPNSKTCPVCLGMPGTLPVINKRAVEFAVKIAIALHCKINSYSIFHRKNYFYPDMPKNYQISQYDYPLGSSGYLDVNMGDYTRRIGITRVHMEEDTGKLIHTGSSGRISESDSSIVDFNRAGTPLIEIVTEPDIKSPAEAKEYLVALRTLLLYLDVSDCSMEQGSLRCDANISIKKAGSQGMGVKTEIKNLNSFRFLQRGLEYEEQRQAALIENGEKVMQQTRHYDHITDSTKALRSKEEAHDYRYFPDPDLVPVFMDDDMVEGIKSSIPELPSAKIERYKSGFGLPEADSRFLASDKNTAAYFESCAALCKKDRLKSVSNWIIGDFTALLNKASISISSAKIKPSGLCSLIDMIESGKISIRSAKSVFEEMFNSGKEPQEIVKGKDMEQISDGSVLEKIIDDVINKNPSVVEQYKSGKEKAIGFLIGQVMAATKGKANPALVNEILIKRLKLNP